MQILIPPSSYQVHLPDKYACIRLGALQKAVQVQQHNTVMYNGYVTSRWRWITTPVNRIKPRHSLGSQTTEACPSSSSVASQSLDLLCSGSSPRAALLLPGSCSAQNTASGIRLCSSSWAVEQTDQSLPSLPCLNGTAVFHHCDRVIASGAWTQRNVSTVSLQNDHLPLKKMLSQALLRTLSVCVSNKQV